MTGEVGDRNPVRQSGVSSGGRDYMKTKLLCKKWVSVDACCTLQLEVKKYRSDPEIVQFNLRQETTFKLIFL